MAYLFPTQSEINAVVKKWTFDEQALIMQSLLPIDSTTFANSPEMITWDVLSAPTGLTNLSSYGAEPITINQRAIRTMAQKPLIFKEEILIGENQLINMRMPGSQSQRAAMESVMYAMEQLQARINTRVETLDAAALTGTISGVSGSSIDYGFTNAQKPNASITSGYGGYWTTTATATPIEDLRKAVDAIKGSGYSTVSLYMSSDALNTMASTSEIKNILIGSQVIPNTSPENVASMLPALVGCGINEVKVSNQYYMTDSGTVTPFLPANKVFIVGKAGGVNLGVFASTPNLYNGGVNNATGGPFVFVIDETAQPVPQIRVVGGIFGIPVLYRPDMICALQISA